MTRDARAFDLNIERVLEDWTVVHALREVIANALDESALTGTAEPVVYADGDGWHVRDWGRGLEYAHLTQNENIEKLDNPDRVIGKFGVGLKDALATFDRKKVLVSIRSRHADITVARVQKHGFESVKTLHAMVGPASDPSIEGTDVLLTGRAVTESAVAAAKALFLQFSDAETIGATRFGQVLRPTGPAKIYVNGLQVATEEAFLFSYNITSSTKKLRQALNRERSNVGRSAYTDRVKDILLACEDTPVVDGLVRDLAGFSAGDQHDETRWRDVGLHACKALNTARRVLFVTASELTTAKEVVERARDDGCEIIVVPDDIRRALPNLTDAAGNRIRDLDEYKREWDESFTFDFVDRAGLTAAEQAVWDELPRILEARGGVPRRVRDIRISQTMRLERARFKEAVGVWDPAERMIVIKRSQLTSVESLAGTVLHEIVHAVSGAPDISAEFEEELTRELGTIVARRLGNVVSD